MPTLPTATALPVSNGNVVFVGLISAVAALGGMLFGYDTAVISGAIGPLQHHFHLSPTETGWAASCALAGCVLGAAIAGPLSDTLGRRSALLISAIAFLLSAVGTALASGVTHFVLFRVIGGLGIGAAAMVSPLYIAEVAPARWRGRLVTLNQLALVFGMFLIYLVNYKIAGLGTEEWNQTTGWRWMFASGAAPAMVLFVTLLFVPETPRFLLLKGREIAARAVMMRIEGAAIVDAELREIRESQLRSGGVTPPRELRIIGLTGIALAVLQQVTGINVFLYYAPELFKNVGRGTEVALVQTVILGAVNLGFTVLSMAFVDRIGRKPLWRWGATGMGCCLCAVGLAFSVPYTGNALLLFALAYMAFFAFSVGPVTWVILAEIFPLRHRGRLMSIATVALWIANFLVSQTFPMLDQNPWLVERLHHGFPFFVYAGFCFLGAWFVHTRLPETKGRTLEEVEQSWASRGLAESSTGEL